MNSRKKLHRMGEAKRHQNLILLLSLAFWGCRESGSFMGERVVHRSAAEAEIGYTWSWSCEAGTGNELQKSGGDLRRLEGYGPHYLKRDVARGLPLRVEGELCGMGSRGRDVLILVDTSLSMTENMTDKPDSQGSCKRFEAVQAILRGVNQGEGASRFALMTFGWGVKNQSAGFFPDAAALYADLLKGAPNERIEDLICSGDEEANFEYVFHDSLELLREFSPSSSTAKEIYLLSDGLVYEGSEGKNEARDLIELGLLGSVRFGLGESLVLKELVSVDEKGQAFISPFSGIDDFMARISTYYQGLSGHGFFEYRGAFEPVSLWAQIPLDDKLKDFRVSFNAFNVDTSRFLEGIDLRLNYKDLKGKNLVIEAQILLTE